MYLNPCKLSTCLTTMRCEGRDDPNLNTSHSSYVASWVAPTLKPVSLIAKVKRKKTCRIREVKMNSHADTHQLQLKDERKEKAEDP